MTILSFKRGKGPGGFFRKRNWAGIQIFPSSKNLQNFDRQTLQRNLFDEFQC